MPGYTDPSSSTEILLRAVSEGDVSEAGFALKFGADIHHNFDQPLRIAVDCGKKEMVEFLISQGADVHALKDDAVCKSVRNNRIEILVQLLEQGGRADADDNQPIIDAAMYGFTDIAAVLLAYGADPRAQGDLPICAAALGGHLGVIKVLAENGADVFCMGSAALLVARSKNHDDVVAYLETEMAAQRASFAFNLSSAPDIATFATGPYLNSGELGLMRALKVNAVDDILPPMLEAQVDISGIWSKGDARNRNLLQIAAERGQLEKIFDARLWRGDMDAMSAAFQTLTQPEKVAGKFLDDDFAGAIAAYRQAVVKKSSKKFRL